MKMYNWFMKLPTLRAEKFSVSIKINDTFKKIFQIIFHSGKENSESRIMVAFPYFKQTKGLLSRLTFPATQPEGESISFIPEGKLTSHLVKFSHPLDGNTHFSGDGKIKTTLWNKSKPLDSQIGHFFTIQLQGVDDFKERPPQDKRLSKKIVDLDFDFTPETPQAVKFVARWSKAIDIKGYLPFPNPETRPQFIIKEPDGSVQEVGFIISPPESFPLSEYVMLVSCKSIPSLTTEAGSHFTFIGGFDENVNHKQDLHFLGCLYPAKEYDQLTKFIENVDFSNA